MALSGFRFFKLICNKYITKVLCYSTNVEIFVQNTKISVNLKYAHLVDVFYTVFFVDNYIYRAIGCISK